MIFLPPPSGLRYKLGIVSLLVWVTSVARIKNSQLVASCQLGFLIQSDVVFELLIQKVFKWSACKLAGYAKCTLRFYQLYQLFLDTGLPRGNGHERGSQVPCKVPSLPNPTTRRGWPHHQCLRPLLFSNSGVGSFTSHMSRSVKQAFIFTYF